MEIRDILVNYRALKKEIKKENINNENITIYMEILELSFKNLIDRQKSDLEYELDNINKNTELLDIIRY